MSFLSSPMWIQLYHSGVASVTLKTSLITEVYLNELPQSHLKFYFWSYPYCIVSYSREVGQEMTMEKDLK